MKMSKLFGSALAIAVCFILAGSCQSELTGEEPSDEPAGEMSSSSEETKGTDPSSVPEPQAPPPPTPTAAPTPPPPTPTAVPTPSPPPLPSGTNVIVAAQGGLGWTIDGEWIGVSDPSSIPAEEGDLYRVLRTGSPSSIDVPGSEPMEGCGPLPGSTTEIDIDDPLFNADGWPYTYPIAISSNWDLTPHNVESLSLESEIYKGFARDILAGVEITEPDPNLITLIRTDLQGDGIDEVIAVTERISGSLISPSPGDYSILFIRRIVGGEVIQELIAGDVFIDEGSGLLYSARLVAVADLNGDGRMEIIMQYGYYEGSSTHVIEYKNDVEGFQQVLVVGCGA